jgi:hypothetical protein
MNYLRQVVDWVRSRAGAIWKAMAPHAGPGVAGGAAVDLVRRRRELVFENAMLRHQIVILRRKSPHPRLTAFDRLQLLVGAAVLPTWRRALAIVQPEPSSGGIARGFARSGVGDPGPGASNAGSPPRPSA